MLYAEKLIVQSVKSSFHQTALKDRIEENARALWALDKLAAYKKTNRNTRPHFRGFRHSRGPSAAATPLPSRPSSRAGSPGSPANGYDRLHVNHGRTGEAVVNVPLTPTGGHTVVQPPPNLRHRSSNNFPIDSGEIREALSRLSNSPDLSKRKQRKRANSKTIAEQVRGFDFEQLASSDEYPDLVDRGISYGDSQG